MDNRVKVASCGTIEIHTKDSVYFVEPAMFHKHKITKIKDFVPGGHKCVPAGWTATVSNLCIQIARYQVFSNEGSRLVLGVGVKAPHKIDTQESSYYVAVGAS